jgi:hypothetical protein
MPVKKNSLTARFGFVVLEGLRFPTKRRVYFRGRASPGSAASLD